MPKMQQAHTDYGTRRESGEREPKGASSSDTSGERKHGGSEHYTKGASGEHEPKGAVASDRTGERKAGIVAGVGMGKADEHGRGAQGGKHDGRTGEFNTGRKEGSVYSHQRHKQGFTHKGY